MKRNLTTLIVLGSVVAVIISFGCSSPAIDNGAGPNNCVAGDPNCETPPETQLTLDEIIADFQGPSEVLDILKGKQFIARKSASVDNAYFDLVSPNLQLLNSQLLMEPPNVADLNFANNHGFKFVIMKSGYEYLRDKLPNYVVFNSGIDESDLKTKGYYEIEVNRNDSNCVKQPANFYSDPATSLKNFRIEGTNIKKLGSETVIKPFCSVAMAVNTFCFPGYNDSAFTKIIAKIHAGEYTETDTIYLCSNMIVTNYDNETVAIDNTYDTASLGLVWKQLDTTRNIWGAVWNRPTPTPLAMVLDGESIGGASNLDQTFIAPDLSTWGTLYSSTAPTFSPVDAEENATIQPARIAAINKANCIAQPATPPCKKDRPGTPGYNIYESIPATNRQQRIQFYHKLTKYHCVNKEAYDNRLYDNYWLPPDSGYDTRNCCRWDTPIPAMQGGSCEMNYPMITPFIGYKYRTVPTYCEQLKTAGQTECPKKFLLLKLASGDTPSNHKIRVTSQAAGFISYWTSNIRIQGLKLQHLGSEGSYAIAMRGDTPKTSQDFFAKLDGNEFFHGATVISYDDSYNPKETSTRAPAKLDIVNNFLNMVAYPLWIHNSAPDINIKNNFFYKTGGKSVDIEEVNYNGDGIPSLETNACEKRKYLSYNTWRESGGIQLIGVNSWCIENNVFDRNYAQETIETATFIANTRIRNNWFLDGAIDVLLAGAPYTLPTFTIENLLIENNQFIRPSKTSQVFDFPGAFSYFKGACRNLNIRNNLFAKSVSIHTNAATIAIASYCENSSIDHNTIADGNPDNSNKGIYVYMFDKAKSLKVTNNVVTEHNKAFTDKSYPDSLINNTETSDALPSWMKSSLTQLGLTEYPDTFWTDFDKTAHSDIEVEPFFDLSRCKTSLETTSDDPCKAMASTTVDNIYKLLKSDPSSGVTLKNNYAERCYYNKYSPTMNGAVFPQLSAQASADRTNGYFNMARINAFCKMDVGGFSKKNPPEFKDRDTNDYRITNAEATTGDQNYSHIGANYADEKPIFKGTSLPEPSSYKNLSLDELLKLSGMVKE